MVSLCGWGGEIESSMDTPMEKQMGYDQGGINDICCIGRTRVESLTISSPIFSHEPELWPASITQWLLTSHRIRSFFGSAREVRSTSTWCGNGPCKNLLKPAQANQALAGRPTPRPTPRPTKTQLLGSHSISSEGAAS